MITLKGSDEVDVRDILLRSPDADIPGAEKILNDCMKRSVEVRCGLYNGHVACMWGLIPPTILSERAYLWLLTTHVVDEHKFLFVRHSQRYVEDMLKIWPTIYGEVLVGNDRAWRWLKWLGARFGEPRNGKIPFEIRRK